MEQREKKLTQQELIKSYEIINDAFQKYANVNRNDKKPYREISFILLGLPDTEYGQYIINQYRRYVAFEEDNNISLLLASSCIQIKDEMGERYYKQYKQSILAPEPI